MEKQRRLPRRELPNIRAQFVRMLDAELPAKSIMVALKLSRSTFFEWKRLYRERGVKGLEVRRGVDPRMASSSGPSLVSRLPSLPLYGGIKGALRAPPAPAPPCRSATGGPSRRRQD